MKKHSEFEEEFKSLAPAALGLLVAIVSFSAIIFLAGFLIFSKNIGVADYIQTLIFFAITGTLIYYLHSQNKKDSLDSSQAYLTSAIDLIDKAYRILSDGGNQVSTNRVSWVTAARLLTRSSILASKITLPSHRIIFESEHDYQRHRFGDLLKIDGNSLPLDFFFGAGYSKDSPVGENAYMTIGSRGDCNWLPASVVAVIYQFKDYPDGYEDPLDTSREFTQAEKQKLWVFGEQGVMDYLVFRKHFHSIGDKIYFIENGQRPVEMPPESITAKMGLLSGNVLFE